MRNAYSNLMREFVDATQVEHADTAPFQIVCPCCAESVFKVARSHREGATSQFFSHRQADKALVSECERRVASIPESDIRSRNALGRGQTLKLFMSVIRDAIDLDWHPLQDREGTKTLVQRACRSAAYDLLEDYMLLFHRKSVDSKFRNEVIEDFISSIGNIGVELNTSFSEKFQIGIASDIMKTLVTPQCRKSYTHLLKHGLNRVTGMIYDGDDGELFGVDLVNLLIRAPQHASKHPIHGFFDVMERSTGSLREFSDAPERLRDLLDLEMMGTLLRLPYREILVNHANGRPLLDGVVVERIPEVPGIGMRR